MTIHIVTNHVPRFPVYGYELSARERERLGLSAHVNECPSDTDGCSGGPGCPDDDDMSGPFAEFVRYRGSVIPLHDFSADWGMTRGTGLPDAFRGWDGFLADSMWSGLLIRYVREGDRVDTDRVIVGRFHATDD